MEAIINLPKEWRAPELEERLMKRLHCILRGPSTSDAPYQKTSGYKWQLDDSNDWWAQVSEDRSQLTIAYRYGYGFPGKLNNLARFLEDFL